jgi:hypothetical protein
VEAMAMALPVIATNWSGPTEYMTETNSYPLRMDGLVEIDEGAFACAPAQASPRSPTVSYPRSGKPQWSFYAEIHTRTNVRKSRLAEALRPIPPSAPLVPTYKQHPRGTQSRKHQLRVRLVLSGGNTKHKRCMHADCFEIDRLG